MKKLLPSLLFLFLVGFSFLFAENSFAQENLCEIDEDCAQNEECFQPDMPTCPQGVSCIQVMPGKYCKSLPIPPDPTPTPTPTPPPNTCAENFTKSKKMRVIEVRYFADSNNILYHPNQLSNELSNALKEASSFHKYNNPEASPSMEVEIVDVINHSSKRPSADGSAQGVTLQILNDNNLCSRIESENIDQIWLWVDPRNDANPGWEYVISNSDFFEYNDPQFVTVATPSFCDIDKSFVVMGFDYSRPFDLALHSFGHYMEGLLGNLQTVNLFWYKFAGGGSENLSSRCGNVHYPPNGATDYDYNNQTTISENFCETWNPSLQGSIEDSFNCDKWNCNQGDYLSWWMQNMPNINSQIVYQDKILPSWWDFVIDMDETIDFYKNQNGCFLNDEFVDMSCSCSGSDYKNQPIAINKCGGTVVGRDFLCYQCFQDGWKVIDNQFCTLPDNLIDADLNTDGSVNILDYAILVEEFGQKKSEYKADINLDKKVNILDYAEMIKQWGS